MKENIQILINRLKAQEKKLLSKAQFCYEHNFQREKEHLESTLDIVSTIRAEIENLDDENYDPHFLFHL